MLVNWQGFDVPIYVHVYSLSMSSQATFKKAKQALIDLQERDRAGAATNAAVKDTASRLKEIHKYHFNGSDIHWSIWANAIHASEAHLREAKMHEAPPSKILELFTRAADYSDNTLREVQRNVSIGRSVNSTTKEAIKQVRGEVTSVKRAIEELTRIFKNLESRMELLEQSVYNNETLLDGVAEATGVVENEVSESAFEQIEALEDPDH